MIRKLPLQLLVICFLSLCSAARSHAQTTTSGGLTGVVTDPSKAVVPDAVVELRDTTKGTMQAAKTDVEGVFRFFFLAPGRYTLTVSHEGFREQSHEVNVLLGPPGTRNVILEIAGGSATVKVTDEMPLLQAENGDASATMKQQQISEVPFEIGDAVLGLLATAGVAARQHFDAGQQLGKRVGLGQIVVSAGAQAARADAT